MATRCRSASFVRREDDAHAAFAEDALDAVLAREHHARRRPTVM